MITKYWVNYETPAICKVEFDRQEGDVLVQVLGGREYTWIVDGYYDSLEAAHVALVKAAMKRWDAAKMAEAAAMEYVRAALASKESAEKKTSLVITGPQYFEDDEPCGYCDRPIGSPHKGWCRQ